MALDKFQKRVQALFADVERLAATPDVDLVAMRQGLAALRERAAEMESRLPTGDKSRLAPEEIQAETPQTAPGRPAPHILYEKAQVGYVYTGEKLESVRAANISGLEAGNALLAPLTDGREPIGAVAVEGQQAGSWSPEDTALAEAVARQVSLQIQNLRLLESSERARAEAQAASRRFAHESWDSFLDAIHQSEQIGYVYDQNAVSPLHGAAPVDADVQETISVLDEQVGKLYLQADPNRPFNEQDRAFAAAVARQLAQQVESLRLVADATRARANAEAATRMLARESWQSYTVQQEESLGFVYDSNRVSAMSEMPQDINFSQDLMVHGEPIGQLAVAGLQEIPPGAEDFLASIAARTSLHLEAIRLTEELQKRAAELQELDRLKSSFLANMSHELRTPLNSILGFSDVMLEGIDGPLTDYMENDLKLIQKNGQHLLHLINDVLDMAKIESGRMNLHPEKFKVHDLFEEVTSITSTLASSKNLSLFIEPSSDKQVEIFADNTRIRQVLINLVNNAIKFTETGKISMRVAPLGDDKILITVKDTGIGISADHLETIFQEFSQVDTSTTRKAGGTGLGLPISRRLVEMHGGRLWAESAGIPGEGSRFFVELPLEAKIAEPIEKLAK